MKSVFDKAKLVNPKTKADTIIDSSYGIESLVSDNVCIHLYYDMMCHLTQETRGINWRIKDIIQRDF